MKRIEEFDPNGSQETWDFTDIVGDPIGWVMGKKKKKVPKPEPPSRKPSPGSESSWPTVGSERKKRREQGDPTGTSFGVIE